MARTRHWQLRLIRPAGKQSGAEELHYSGLHDLYIYIYIFFFFFFFFFGGGGGPYYNFSIMGPKTLF